ncbi:UDP-N-acetylglucosamine--peptide N-acetylglucosaminyltransferase-like [Sipha flava]|uniref:protein O-GlcNAc transferase n=1 Tax=Sipha flava TaxID=143950 RepID=A0A2S2QKB5_9HEMI|nr:UDP-N-acetylglucosamine--peptide N-acetylglucosaminyltransferase-like [Sipha flava]
MATFCGKHSNTQAPISVISELLYEKDPIKFKDLDAKFKTLGIFKVKDLANSSFTQVGQMPLGDDPIAVLYGALELYDQQCKKQLKTAHEEYENNNIVNSQIMGLELLKHNDKDINTLILLTATYFRNEEYDESIKYCCTILKIEPNCSDAYRNLGSNYFKKCDLIKAIEAYYYAAESSYDNDCWYLFAKAIILNHPETAEFAYQSVLHYKPDLYLLRYEYANYLFSLNRMKEAENQFEMVANDKPEFSPIFNNLGCIHFKNNKENALHHYNKAVDLDPKLTVAWVNLGITYIKLKKYDDAIEVFQKASQLDPNNSTSSQYLARIYLKQENIVSAIDTYKKYLLIQPNNVEVNYELGVVYLNSLKNSIEAIKYLEKCMELNLKTKDFFINLAKTYIALGKKQCASMVYVSLGDYYIQQNDEKAKRAYTAALLIDPDNAEGHWKLGIQYFRLGLLDMAAKRYSKSIELRPNFPDVYYDSAKLFETKKLYEKALKYYNMVLQLQPDHYNAYYDLILLNQKLGRTNDIFKLNNEILLRTNSYNFEGHIEMGNIFYYNKRNLELALLHYEKALSIDSTSPNVYIYKGNVLLELKKTGEALKCFETAIKLDPHSIIAHTNIGSIYKNKGNFMKAINSYEIVLKLRPDFPDAYCNLIQCYQYICNWQDYDFYVGKLKDIILKQINDGQLPSIDPYHSLMYPFSSEVLKEIASKNAEKCIEKSSIEVDLIQSYNYPISLTPDGCIRVGYVSSDFGNHPVLQLMQSIPNLHNKSKIEVFFYALSSNDDSKSWFKISESDHFRDISKLNVVDAADQINSDGIHILINMNGYTEGARNEIFALRPAAIQVVWLGYPGTSGATFIDYLITDKICSPPEFNHYYTEKLAYMNQTVFVGDHKQLYGDLSPRINNKHQKIPTRELKTTIVLNKGHLSIKNQKPNHSILPTDVPTSMYSIRTYADGQEKFYTRSQYNLPENAIVYCNFDKLYKIDPHTFKMWITILKNVPNSVLWLLKFSEAGVKNLLSITSSSNVNRSRIIFSDMELKDDHMRRIQLADIFLDTCICNGHTTCLDALWAGVPIVTLPGETFASRVSASQLTTLGCTETIALNKEQYIDIAVKFGKDKHLLENLRSKIWTLRTESKLFDCKSYAEELEIIYEDIWNKFLFGNQLDI